MTRKDQLACLTDRPCSVCKFHRENGCCKWSCVFEEEPEEEATDELKELEVSQKEQAFQK